MIRLLVPLTLLVGCAPMPATVPSVPAPGVLCNADPAQSLIGKEADTALVERARTLAGAKTARRITPNMRVTMEFRPDRLNVWLALDGTAERITCG